MFAGDDSSHLRLRVAYSGPTFRLRAASANSGSTVFEASLTHSIGYGHAAFSSLAGATHDTIDGALRPRLA